MVTINTGAFQRRLKTLYDSWKDGAYWNGATCVAVISGAAAEGLRYWKSTSLHLWLLGYEFTDTLLLFTKSEVHALAGAKKVQLLQQLEGACRALGLALVLHTKGKKEDGSEQMGRVLEAAKAAGDTPLVGVLPKEKPEGPFASLWLETLAGSGLSTVDVGAALADAWAVKDEDELKNLRKAAFLVSSAVNSFAVPQIEEIIDQEMKVKHSKLAAKTEEVITDPSKINIKLKAELLDIAYPPVFQSGGEYDVRLAGAVSNDNSLHYGVIVCSLGAKYASYCANVARTYFVDPSKKQEEEYAALLAAHQAAVAALVEGAPMSAAHEAVVKALKVQRAGQEPAEFWSGLGGGGTDGGYYVGMARGQGHLVEKLPRSLGSAIGLELRDSTQQLSANNAKPVRAGMTFNVVVGVSDLTRDDPDDEPGRRYAMLVADTVIIKAGGGAPDYATAAAPKDWKEVAYYLKGGVRAFGVVGCGVARVIERRWEGETAGRGQDEGGEDGGAAPAVDDEYEAMAMRKSTRTEHVDFQAKADERRRQKENQEDLLQRVNQATLNMLNKNGADGRGGAGPGGRRVSETVAYKSVSEMQQFQGLTVQVDHRSECILVPIYGMLVPFHILTVKNATYNQEGDTAYIRVNFNFGPSFEPGARFPRSVFVKELSYRSADSRHAAKVVQEIKMLRGAVQQREKEKAERATLVQQEKLVRGKGRVYSLPDVWVRPAFGGKGRKVTGTLEAHANGFRYTSPKGEELDIMYRNVKHAFFQPAENEMITLVHFHLINPIMVGKKKTNDVQFYTEVMDTVQTLEAGRRSMYDPDEIEEEQRERERRNSINRQFSQFVKRVQQDIWERDYSDLNLEFEIPFRELGFFGVPSRSSAFIMPTVNCLVELTEMPFTVLTLSEVNLVNLERVGFNLRNFDMVLIMKDLNRDVARIDTIPTQYLDTIKDWLNSIEIKFYESKVNLQWKNILKSIKEDPEQFIADGGWNFLDVEQSDSEEEADEESDFAPSGGEDESDDDVDSEDESVVSEDDSDAEAEDDSEEEGMDWDDLEEQAKRDDEARDDSDGEDEGYNRKRKGGGSGGRPAGGSGKRAKR
ncbi:hypothetical protein N2152v2_007440 [Parachlorella kessleri]